MSVDLFSRVRGAGSYHYKGIDLWSNDVGQLDLDLKPFSVKSDAHGTIARRGGGRLFTATFTPVGAWTAAQLAVLFPYLNPVMGDFNTPMRAVTAVNYGAGTLTVPGHGYLTGTGIRFGASRTTTFTLPTGIAANTTYYAIAVDANTLSLATTEALAIAGTAITFSTAGAGAFFVIQNSPLIITTVDGVQLTILNAAVVDMPDLTIHSLVSTMKAVKFEGYTLHGMKWSDANSLFTLASGVIGAVPPDQSQIPTVSPTVDWATRVPFSAENTTADTVTIPNHGMLTGQSFTIEAMSAGATLPTPLAAGTTYYAIFVDANTIKVASSSGNATAGTAIDLTATGTGSLCVVTNLVAEGIETKDGVSISIKVTWGDVGQSSDSIVARSISEVNTKVEFNPTNLGLLTLTNALALQGGNAAQGQNLPFANLDIYGPGFNPFIRVYNATLENLPVRFGSSADRIEKLTFNQQRGFRGITQLPFAALGVAAPTL